MCEYLTDAQIEIAQRHWLNGLTTHDIAHKLLVPEFMVANSLPEIRKLNFLKKGDI